MLIAFIRGIWFWNGWRPLLARLPLPMLALAASYGVYRFALLFVPPAVAVVQAAAFELVYIGLAVADVPPAARRRAGAISIGAVVVSMLYNTLDGLFHLRPALLDAPALWLHIVLAALHGVPLAALAYLVADLLLHAQSGAQRATAHSDSIISFQAAPPDERPAALPDERPAAITGGRPPVHTIDTMLQAFTGAETITRSDVLDKLDCSTATADRLLAAAAAAGLIERVERGVYRPVEAAGQ